MEDSVQTVEIIKQPGQTLGFYIREGNGIDRWNGVFISRIAPGSVVAKNNLLRVNDEILTVNTIDVTHMSLDDVVILMSIARRLVLTIRIGHGYTSQPMRSEMMPKEVERDGRQPVVVLKSGFANSYNDMSVDDRSPDEMLQCDISGNDSNGRIIPGHYEDSNFKNDKCMSGTRSNRSKIPVRSLSQTSWDQGNIQYVNSFGTLPRYGCESRGFQRRPVGQQLGFSPTRSANHADYASDTDVMYHHQSRIPAEKFVMGSGNYRDIGTWSGARMGYNDRVSRSSERHGSNSSQNIGRRLMNGRMTPEQYSSDSEVMTRYQKPLRGRAPASSARHRNISSDGSGDDDLYSTLSQAQQDGYVDCTQAMINNMVLSHRNHTMRPKTAGSFVDLRSAVYGDVPSSVPRKHSSRNQMSLPTDRQAPLTSEEYVMWLNHNVAPSNLRSKQGFSSSLPVNYRLTRKMSTDSLLDYKTYQMDDPGSTFVQDSRRPWDSSTSTDFQQLMMKDRQTLGGSSAVPVSRTKQQMKNSSSSSHMSGGQSGGQSSGQSGGQSGGQSSGQTSNQLGDGKSKGSQLSRMPLKIQTETFQACPADLPELNDLKGLNGQLFVHVFCGHGLKSSRTALRDLYCVIEVDTTTKARTMVRTGAINFDWDEEFEIDVMDAKKLFFLVNSWDPHTRHRLCFTGTVPLANLIKQSKEHRLAIKLEPKGMLYVELNFREASQILRRLPSIHRNAVFGVDLKDLIMRERSGKNIPILVQRCIDEVEKRGLDQVGLYRLCGSARRKHQLREDFERNARLADLTLESVSDVNVITSVLKDFLLELPEPLCSNALYDMLMDALSVQMPGDVEGNAQLMLGILECLPRVNQDTLAYLLDHLKRVVNKSENNKMTTQNLAVCFGPALVCPSSENDRARQHCMDFNKQADLLKCLLDIWQESSSTDQRNLAENRTDDSSTRNDQQRNHQTDWSDSSSMHQSNVILDSVANSNQN